MFQPTGFRVKLPVFESVCTDYFALAVENQALSIVGALVYGNNIFRHKAF
jgi:hypothetical protein